MEKNENAMPKAEETENIDETSKKYYKPTLLYRIVGENVVKKLIPNLDEYEKQPSLNERLKELRLEYGLTQEQVGKVLKISHREYWRYEQEGYTPNFDKLVALALFYNVSLDWISGFPFAKRETFGGSSKDKSWSVNGYRLKDMKKSKD